MFVLANKLKKWQSEFRYGERIKPSISYATNSFLGLLLSDEFFQVPVVLIDQVFSLKNVPQYFPSVEYVFAL